MTEVVSGKLYSECVSSEGVYKIEIHGKIFYFIRPKNPGTKTQITSGKISKLTHEISRAKTALKFLEQQKNNPLSEKIYLWKDALDMASTDLSSLTGIEKEEILEAAKQRIS